MSIGIRSIIHLIGHIFMMHMDSFNLQFWSNSELICVPNHSRNSFILIKINSLSPCPEIVSVHWTSQCNSLNWTYLYDADQIPSISGFDSCSRAHLRSESFQRFIYFNKIQHFDPVSGDC